MDPSYLKNMLSDLESFNLDFLFASRYQKPGGGSEDDNFITSIGNFFFTKLGNLFFSLNISDILFKYVIGKTDSFNALNLNSQDFTFCVEFPIKMVRKNYKYKVIPSFERRRIAGVKKVNVLKDGFFILFAMIKLYLNNSLKKN